VAPVELSAASLPLAALPPARAEVAHPEALWALSAMLRRACLLSSEAAGRARGSGAWVGWRGSVHVDTRVRAMYGAHARGGEPAGGCGAVPRAELRALGVVVCAALVRFFDASPAFRARAAASSLVAAPLLAVALAPELLSQARAEGV
jgi:hypothetical protein